MSALTKLSDLRKAIINPSQEDSEYLSSLEKTIKEHLAKENLGKNIAMKELLKMLADELEKITRALIGEKDIERETLILRRDDIKWFLGFFADSDAILKQIEEDLITKEIEYLNYNKGHN